MLMIGQKQLVMNVLWFFSLMASVSLVQKKDFINEIICLAIAGAMQTSRSVEELG